MRGELQLAFTHETQLALDLRAIFRMETADLLRADVTTGVVVVHRLLWDTGTMLGARVAGYSQPLSQGDVFALAAHAAAINEGRPKNSKPVIPVWPWPDPDEKKRTKPAQDVTPEERRRLREQLDRYSAIPGAQEDGGES